MEKVFLQLRYSKKLDFPPQSWGVKIRIGEAKNFPPFFYHHLNIHFLFFWNRNACYVNRFLLKFYNGRKEELLEEFRMFFFLYKILKWRMWKRIPHASFPSRLISLNAGVSICSSYLPNRRKQVLGKFVYPRSS